VSTDAAPDTITAKLQKPCSLKRAGLESECGTSGAEQRARDSVLA
jgi:hypothetical protein